MIASLQDQIWKALYLWSPKLPFLLSLQHIQVEFWPVKDILRFRLDVPEEPKITKKCVIFNRNSTYLNIMITSL